MAKSNKKTPVRLAAEKLARKKRIFHFFERLVVGAVKVWFDGKPYIVAVDEVDAFCKEQIELMKK